ncbi:MAG: cysteine desulfurase family protein [Patescibacteria group bacterium]
MTAQTYYLDHAAATPLDERVLKAMMPFFLVDFYNPSSPYAPAVKVRREYDAAKSRLASTFGGRGDEVVITAGATESINLAFSGVNGHIVTSAIEHDAVLAAAKVHSHTLVAPTDKGIVTAEAVALAITPETELVSIQLANNEIGTIQPIRDIATVVSVERQRRRDSGDDRPVYLHCDGSQGFGQIDSNVARLGVDMLTLNSGKMYGPKQVGLLWAKPGVRLKPQIVGGGQERGLRSGTENVAGVIGFAEAAKIACDHRKSESERLASLRNTLERRLSESIDGLLVTGHPKRRLPGSLHISVLGLDGERLVFALEAKGVFVATGSACAANKGTRSHVLTALGLSDEAADGSLRITLGRLSDESTIGAATAIIIDEIKRELDRVHGA